MTTTPAEPRTWLLTFSAPAELLTLNKRHHWRTRAKLTRKWRELAAVVARVGRVPTLRQARIEVAFIHPTNRRRDAHNLYPTYKAIVDGLVDAKVLPDDDDAHLVSHTIRNEHDGTRPWVSCRVHVIAVTGTNSGEIVEDNA